MNRNVALAATVTLLAGIAIGWTARSCLPEKPVREKTERASGKRHRIADSQTRVKTVTAVVTNVVQSTVTNTVETRPAFPGGPGGFVAELERMKNADPKRYASMTNHMAQFRARMAQRTENKLETLASIDTTGWNKSQIENHLKYQELIARRQELMETIRHDSGATREEREAAFGEMRELGRELRAASEKERNTLLDKTFQELGYSGADSRELRETVKTIYSTTEEWGGGPGGRGRRGRGGPPPIH